MSKAIYYETINKESHINIFRSLEIENYFKHSLKKQGFELHEYNLSFSNTEIRIFLSLYKKIDSKKFKKHLYHRVNSKHQLESYKKNSQKQTQRNFWKNSLKGFNKLTKNQYKISLKVKWITEKFLKLDKNKNKKKKPKIDLRNLRTRFFFEIKKLYLVLATQKNSANLLSLFISQYLKATKRHNFFLNKITQSLKPLVEQKHSKINGLKIVLKGRLNNAPRSRNKVIQVGKIPLITQNTNLDYSESVAFTKNGTIGVKIWINQAHTR